MDKTKEEIYQEATLKNLSDANGTRMDVVYLAMEEYGKQKYKEGFESFRSKVEEGVKKMNTEDYRVMLSYEEALKAIREIKQ